MSYHYQSYSKTTTTTRDSTGQTHTRTTRTTTTSSSESGTVVIREVSEGELEHLPLENTENYEIYDDDRLTKFDFYSLMNTEDEDSESESESDVERHWFPSLSRTSFIEFLNDSEQENYMEDDTTEAIVQENDDDEDYNEEEDQEEEKLHGHNGKRYHKRHLKKHSKRPKRTEQVPVDVIHVIL